jgi:hypothetical protein
MPAWKSTRLAVVALGAAFVLFGASAVELGPDEARLGLASGESLGPFGKAFGYWDPAIWPASVALGHAWAWFEEQGPSQDAIRWPAAIAGVIIGFVLARRARLIQGARAGLLVALAWFGSLGLIDHSSASLDLIAGLGTVAALDLLLCGRASWGVGCWASLAFLGAGWPPLALIAMVTVVLGRPGTWSWKAVVPVLATVAAWSAWALSVAPAEAWASALAMPITQTSAWSLALVAAGLGLPWSPFVLLAASRSIRESWATAGHGLPLGWIKVLGASLIVGTLVPGFAKAALVPALAGLAFVAATCWDRLWTDSSLLPQGVTRRASRLALLMSGLWLAVVLGWGGYVGFAVAYYRATVIVVGIISLAAFLLAFRSVRLGEVRWALGAVVALSVALKLAHWGYYAPELNYRTGAGPWGRAIGQWVPEKHAIYVLHSWPADLAFATGRPVRQLETPMHIEYQPEAGSKFVLLQDSEFAEYQNWSKGWPKLIKVAEFEDEMGLGKRYLTRTDAPLIIERPFRKHDPVE